MKTIVILFSLFSLWLFSSCAGVKIYSDPELSKPSAIRFHYPKPFLLVEKNANANGGKKASIVYLPDMSEAFYAKTKSGFGQSDLKMVFENGSLASYGISTDTKIPETITALSAALNSGLKFLPNMNGEEKPLKTGEPDFELYAIQIIEGKLALRKLEVKL